jgi:hypothetical protein
MNLPAVLDRPSPKAAPPPARAKPDTVFVVVRLSVFREEFIDLELPAEGKTIAELFEQTEAEVFPHQGVACWLRPDSLVRV